MNKVILMGRLVCEPDVRYMQSEKSTAVARYSLAVPRKFKRDGEPDCDFINCVAFGKMGEFTEKYLRKGTKVVITGRIQTGSYTNRDGVKVYTTDIIVEEQEFAESKNASQQNEQSKSENMAQADNSNGDFMSIPDGLDSELPFN